jgi:hypothetical protein
LLILATILTELTLKLWNVMISHQNTATIFSYEILSNFFYELCSFYSKLFYNPESLLINSTKQMKTLIDMIEQVCFTHMNSAVLTSNSNSFEDNTPLTIVRLKILNNILTDNSLFEVCKKNMQNFQAKLVNFLIFAYLYNTNVNKNDSNETNGTSREATDKTNLADSETKIFVRLANEKILVFKELGLRSDDNIEQFVINFIAKYSIRIKNIQVNILFR